MSVTNTNHTTQDTHTAQGTQGLPTSHAEWLVWSERRQRELRAAERRFDGLCLVLYVTGLLMLVAAVWLA